MSERRTETLSSGRRAEEADSKQQRARGDTIASKNGIIASKPEIIASGNEIIASENVIIASENEITASENEIVASENRVAVSGHHNIPSAKQVKAPRITASLEPDLRCEGQDFAQERTPLGRRLAHFLSNSARVLLDLFQMLRTCHVGALLTKRLIFGALLGSHVTASEPATWQAGALLVTSLAYVIWLLVGKPYVSRAVQGAETAAALLELLTLGLSLQSARAATTPHSARARGSAMLALQLLAIAVQMGYQCWAAVLELRAGWLWWREVRSKGVNRGLGRVKGSLNGRDLRISGRKTVGRTERRKDVASEHGRRRRDGERAGNGDRSTGRGSALTSPNSSRTRSRSDGPGSWVGRPESRSGRLMRTLTRRKKVWEEEGNLSGNPGSPPRAEAALGSSAESLRGGSPRGRNERGGKKTVVDRKLELKGGLGRGEGKGGRKSREFAQKGRDGKDKNGRKHAGFRYEEDLEGRHNEGEKNQGKSSRRGQEVGSLSLGHGFSTGNGSPASGRMESSGKRDSSAEKRLIRINSRPKEAGGSTMSSFVVEEDSDSGGGLIGTTSYEGPRKRMTRLKSRRALRRGSILSSFVVEEDADAGAAGSFDVRGRKQLMRLNSRKREMGNATMSSFVVAESDESEGENADWTAEQSTMRVVVRQEMVTSYTVTRGSRLVE